MSKINTYLKINIRYIMKLENGFRRLIVDMDVFASIHLGLL